MTSSARAARGLAAAAVLACLAALATACGTSSAPAASPDASPAVTATPTVSAGTASPASSPTVAPTQAGPPPCVTSALKVTVPKGQGNAAAGSSYYPIQFANASGTSCTLYGYPGISFVTAPGGRQIGPAATRNPAVARRLVTLSPGQTVHAELQVVNAENYPPADCGLVAAHWLKIYPPNQTAPAYVGFTAQACSKPKQILSVQTVQPGTAGT